MPAMRENKSGSIVNIAPVVAVVGQLGYLWRRPVGCLLKLMRSHCPEALVAGYEGLVPQFVGRTESRALSRFPPFRA